jgi:hypothetical protein
MRLEAYMELAMTIHRYTTASSDSTKHEALAFFALFQQAIPIVIFRVSVRWKEEVVQYTSHLHGERVVCEVWFYLTEGSLYI